MNLHEYQAKMCLAKFGIPVPRGEVVNSVEQALNAWQNLATDKVVVKAQVHAGGRGKAGGVRITSSKEELTDAVKSMIGKNLVTYQTSAEGQPVHKVLIEEPCDIDRELYLGAVVDRGTNNIVFMASTEGGVDIEAVAANTPELIHKVTINPMLGVQGFQGRALAFKLGLEGDQIKSFCKILFGLSKMFQQYDLSLLEINPLVVTKSGALLCLDGKINIDGNALYRQPEIRELNDPTQSDERENIAEQWELNYIALDGNIGCMVNGAGLAMATMDLIKLHGGEPANFLDVGGGATAERVAEAFKIILSDQNVKVVLVNIFGGIVRCDLIADGIIAAIAEVDVKCPVVVRLEGNNAKTGLEKLSKSGLNISPAHSFDEAAKQAVELLGA